MQIYLFILVWSLVVYYTCGSSLLQSDLPYSGDSEHRELFSHGGLGPTELPHEGIESLTLLHLAQPGTSSSYFHSLMQKIARTERSMQPGYARCLVNCTQQQQDYLIHGSFIYHAKHMHEDHTALIGYAQLLKPEGQRTYSLVTFVRDPVQYVTKNYGMRQMWDKGWRFAYPHISLKSTNVSTWAELAYWRYNIQTRTIAGDMTPEHRILNQMLDEDGIVTKAEALRHNAEGVKSMLYRTAINNLDNMLFYGVFEEMKDSYELFFYTFCRDSTEIWAPEDMRELVPREIEEGLPDIVAHRYELDHLLYDYAVHNLRARVNKMRDDKTNDIMCRLTESECILQCPPTPGMMHDSD